MYLMVAACPSIILWNCSLSLIVVHAWEQARLA